MRQMPFIQDTDFTLYVGEAATVLRTLPDESVHTVVTSPPYGSALTLAYLAGVLDSDGTIGIKRSTYAMRVTGDSSQPVYSERIHIRQVTREAVDLFAATFGGNVTPEDPHAKRGRPLWKWGQTDKKAATTLVALFPHLKIKRAQAANCLALREVKERSKIARMSKGRGHAGGARRPEPLSVEMETLYLRAKELNRVGVLEGGGA